MKSKRKELIRNLTQTISKESKKVNGGNKQFVEKLQKLLDKVKKSAYLFVKVLLFRALSNDEVISKLFLTHI